MAWKGIGPTVPPRRRVAIRVLEPGVGIQHEIPAPAAWGWSQSTRSELQRDFVPWSGHRVTVVGLVEQRQDVAIAGVIADDRLPGRFPRHLRVVGPLRTVAPALAVLRREAAIMKI